MRRRWIVAGLVGTMGAAAFGASAVATPPAPTGGVTTTLTKASFDDISASVHTRVPVHWRARLRTRGLSDVYVVDNKFSARSDTGWHTHPGPSLILVVSGTVTDYESDAPGCAPRRYTQGQGFVDAGGRAAHILRNETDATAETMAVQILPKDSLRRMDAAPPAGCPRF